MKVVVIGASHGGMEAVQALVEKNEQIEVEWFDSTDITGELQKTKLQNGSDKTHITQMTVTELAAAHVTCHGLYQANGLDSKNKIVTFLNLQTGNVEQVTYDKLILATGAHAFILPVPGNELKNIFTFRHGEQDELVAALRSPKVKNVVIVGAGYIGMMATDMLARIGQNKLLALFKKKITVIDVTDRPLETYLDSEFTDILTTHMNAQGVKFVPQTKVQEFRGNKNGKVSAVVTNHGTFPADFVLVSAGTRPNTDWLGADLEMTARGYVVTNDYCQTSAEDVFAIGDITEIRYTPTGKKMNIALASNAERQARAAVRNLTKQVRPLQGVQGSSALQLFGEYFASTGLNTVTAARAQQPMASVYLNQDNSLASFNKGKTIPVAFKLFYAPDTLRILGAAIMSADNQTAQINAISIAIQAGMTVRDLTDTDLFFQPKLTNMWNVINAAAIKALPNE